MLHSWNFTTARITVEVPALNISQFSDAVAVLFGQRQLNAEF
jgi:hypothetical protein